MTPDLKPWPWSLTPLWFLHLDEATQSVYNLFSKWWPNGSDDTTEAQEYSLPENSVLTNSKEKKGKS